MGLQNAQLRTLSRSVTPCALHKNPISAACTWKSSFNHYPRFMARPATRGETGQLPPKIFKNIVKAPIILPPPPREFLLVCCLAHGQRWGSEQRPILKNWQLCDLKAPVLWPRNDEAHATLCFLCQSLYCYFICLPSSPTRKYHPIYLNFSNCWSALLFTCS